MIEQSHMKDGTQTGQVLDDVLEQISKKMQAGEPVDLEAYVAEHPEYEDEDPATVAGHRHARSIERFGAGSRGFRACCGR